MGKLSKTALASLRTETAGSISRTPLAWVFQRKVGKMQTRPYATCYVPGQAEAIVEAHPELELILVAPAPSVRSTVRK